MKFNHKEWLKAKGLLKSLVLASHHGLDSVVYFNMMTLTQTFPKDQTIRLLSKFKYQWLTYLVFFWEEANGKCKVEVLDLSSGKPMFYRDLSESIREFQTNHLKEQEQKFNLRPTGNAIIHAPVIQDLPDKTVDRIIELLEDAYHSPPQE